MKYYIDTEFIEAPNFIELISIGIKCQDGRTLYAESSEFDKHKASDWVKENVISKLIWHNKEVIPFQATSRLDKEYTAYGPLKIITEMILTFINDDIPEFWGYYADYDWVVFCWLFGSMIDLPSNFPMYCKDLKQLIDETGKDLILDPINEHNALADAIWNEKLHLHLMK